MTKAPEKTKSEKAAPEKSASEKSAPAKAASGKAAPGKAAPAKAKSAKGAIVEKPKAGHKPNALQQPLQPSPELAAIVGEGTMPRGEVVSKVWQYIKSNKLQNPDDGREILPDDKLNKVLGKSKVTMFEMNKLLAQHLK